MADIWCAVRSAPELTWGARYLATMRSTDASNFQALIELVRNFLRCNCQHIEPAHQSLASSDVLRQHTLIKREYSFGYYTSTTGSSTAEPRINKSGLLLTDDRPHTPKPLRIDSS